jgi:MFS family permease
VTNEANKNAVNTDAVTSTDGDPAPTLARFATLSPLRFVVWIGVISAFGDWVYEGAASNIGPFLEHLGATAAGVGIITGVGQALAYGIRLISGPLIDRTHKPWPQTIIGYALQVVCVPLLGIAGSLAPAALLYNGERFGKAIRSPARDTMLAHASSRIGRGKAFGLHEALDQSGALIGPLFVALILWTTGSVRASFAFLAIPGLAVLLLLLRVRSQVPDPSQYDPAATVSAKKRLRLGRDLPTRFWIYLVYAALTMFGFATWPLLAYHMALHRIVGPAVIPVLYAVSMGSAALFALVFGRLYDSIGLRGLVVLPIAAAAIPFVAFSQNVGWVVVGAVLWGAVMGIHESTLSAAVADLVPRHRLGMGYGVFTSCYGLAWLAGAAIIGWLYESGTTAVEVYTVAIQAAALVCCIPLLASRFDQIKSGDRGSA